MYKVKRPSRLAESIEHAQQGAVIQRNKMSERNRFADFEIAVYCERQYAFVILLIALYIRVSSECTPEISDLFFCFAPTRRLTVLSAARSCCSAPFLLRAVSRILRVLPSRNSMDYVPTATDYDVHGFVLNARRQSSRHECDEKSLDVSRGGSLQLSS